MFDSRNAAIIDICRSYELVEESVLKNLLASSEELNRSVAGLQALTLVGDWQLKKRRDHSSRATEKLLSYSVILKSESCPQSDVPTGCVNVFEDIVSTIWSRGIAQASDGKVFFVEEIAHVELEVDRSSEKLCRVPRHEIENSHAAEFHLAQ